jgi:Tfp pilus assembly PilM family ATPase
MRLRLSSPPQRGPKLLGIDLSPGHARLMACTRSQRGWRVERCAERELARESLGSGPLQQFDALSRTLRELVHEAGAGMRVVLSLPAQAMQRRVLAVPAGLPPWQWRSWLGGQAEQLSGAPVQSQAIDVQLLNPRPLTVLLSVCTREVLEDWLGLAEAAGLQLAAVDDRVRAMHLALEALGLAAPLGRASCALAEAGVEQCWLHVWRPGLAVQSQDLAAESGWVTSAAQSVTHPPAGGWLVGRAADAARWADRLAADAPGDWPVLDLQERLQWADHVAPPIDSACYLTAFGLALRGGA